MGHLAHCDGHIGRGGEHGNAIAHGAIVQLIGPNAHLKLARVTKRCEKVTVGMHKKPHNVCGKWIEMAAIIRCPKRGPGRCA